MKYVVIVLTRVLFFLQFNGTAGICPGDSYTSKIPLYFGYMAPTDPNGIYNGQGSVVAVNLALDKINNNESLLYGYTLSYNGTVFDSKCDRITALEQYFEIVDNPPVYNALIGTGCSTSTEPVAELTHFWNLPMVSYASAAPELSTRSRFPSFFRTYASDVAFIPGFVATLQTFNWTRLCIITEEINLFLQNQRPLRIALENANITMSEQSFTFPSEHNVSSEIITRFSGDIDTHIFFINTFERSAKTIICALYKLGLRYPAYTFITHGWYQARWWSNEVINFTVPCTEEELLIQLDRSLAIQQRAYAINETAPTISGLSADEFEVLYRRGLNQIGASFIGEGFTAYDAVWTLALALDKVQRAICTNDNLGCNISQTLTPLEDYQYYNAQMECMLNRTLSATGFEGVSGYVSFDVNGTREHSLISIFQYQTAQYNINSNDSARVLIGDLNTTNNYSYIARQTVAMVWPLGIPPDGTPKKERNRIHLSVVIIFDVLAVVGIIFALVCLVLNIVFRNKKIIKLTSPNLSYIIAIGALISYSSIILQLQPGLDVYSLNIRCIAGYWLNIIGYTLSFSAVLARMWRVNYIFHNPTARKRNLKDWYLLCLAGILTLIVIVLLALGEAIPQTRHKPTLVDDDETTLSKINELNVPIQYCVYRCYSDQVTIAYQAVVFFYLFVLQIIGIVLALQTRKIKIKSLNDAKPVAAIVYITTLYVVVNGMAVFALSNYLNANSVLFGLSTIFATTVFLILIFMPKFYMLYKDPEGENALSTSKDISRVGGVGISDSQDRRSSAVNVALAMIADDPKATISLLQSQVQQLEAQLKKYETIPEEDETHDTSTTKSKLTFFSKSRSPRNSTSSAENNASVTIVDPPAVAIIN